LRILREQGRGAVAWKNGGGTTREVCAVPPVAGFDFAWRLSIADVRSGGPFSRFDGIDRKLAVIEGRMQLSIDKRKPVDLSPASPPLSFSGEADVDAEVIAPVIDVNLMTRRNRYSGALERLDLIDTTALGEHDAETVILALDPIVISGRELAAFDAAWLEESAMVAASPCGALARVVVARVWPVPASETD
jgi:environmental stress-induced protein Ves